MQVIYNFFLYNKKKIKNILCGCKIYIYSYPTSKQL